MSLSPNEILENLNAAAAQRQLSRPTLAAYRRIWRDIVIRAAAQSLDPAALPRSVAEEFYAELTRGRGASHHLQTKAAVSFLYRMLDAPNPFADCVAPKFRLESVEIQHLDATPLSKVLLELQRSRRTYFDHLVSHLAEALFFTACRFHEWALLTSDKLVRNGVGKVTAVRLKVKGGRFRDVPVLPRLSESLAEWIRFLEGIKGHRLRRGHIGFAGSDLVFPGREGSPPSNQAFNRRLAAACRGAGTGIITAHGLRHSAASLLLNERGRNLRELQDLLGHKNLSTTARYTHIDKERLRSVVGDLNLASE
ncbi:MAG: integrase/recombinase XerD [Verrucomicrobiales bacterium]|nr:integrase/recombinase XerD [Verrucomicrobiales bacterium]